MSLHSRRRRIIRHRETAITDRRREGGSLVRRFAISVTYSRPWDVLRPSSDGARPARRHRTYETEYLACALRRIHYPQNPQRVVRRISKYPLRWGIVV